MLRGALVLGLAAVLPLSSQQPAIRLTRVASGLSRPTDIQHAGDGTNRLFLVEQDGRIRILRNGVLLPGAFLDIRDRVTKRTQIIDERGLLGLAFPPGEKASAAG